MLAHCEPTSPYRRGYRASRTRNITSPRWGEVESECNELSGEGEPAVGHFDPGDLLTTASVPGVGLCAGGIGEGRRGVLHGWSAAGRACRLAVRLRLCLRGPDELLHRHGLPAEKADPRATRGLLFHDRGACDRRLQAAAPLPHREHQPAALRERRDYAGDATAAARTGRARLSRRRLRCRRREGRGGCQPADRRAARRR